jgi:hypothetical protein
LKALAGNRWRIGNLVYAYFPVVDNETLLVCSGFANSRLGFLVIVPTGCDCLLSLALKGALGGRAPSVFSFDLFISWRATFASVDLGMRRCETVFRLLIRYNELAGRTKDHRRFLVNLPSTAL